MAWETPIAAQAVPRPARADGAGPGGPQASTPARPGHDPAFGRVARFARRPWQRRAALMSASQRQKVAQAPHSRRTGADALAPQSVRADTAGAAPLLNERAGRDGSC